MTDVPQTDDTSPSPSQVHSEPGPAVERILDCRDEHARGPAITRAIAAVRSGACVVLPTDTVYGIGADAFNTDAVEGLLRAKGRGRDMPPPVLVADPMVLMALGRDIPDAAKKLAEHFWPGALTLIVQAQSSLRMDLGETQGTIAVRVPDHDIAREFLRGTGPLAVSSANRTGEPAAVSVETAAEQLGTGVALYLDGGPTPGLVPSTIVDFTASEYGVLVRQGRIPVEELRELVPYLEDRTGDDFSDPYDPITDPVEPEPLESTANPVEPEPLESTTDPVEPEPLESTANPAEPDDLTLPENETRPQGPAPGGGAA